MKVMRNKGLDNNWFEYNGETDKGVKLKIWVNLRSIKKTFFSY